MKELFDVCKERAETVTYTLKVSTVDTSQHLILPLKSKRMRLFEIIMTVCLLLLCVQSVTFLKKKHKNLILSKGFS